MQWIKQHLLLFSIAVLAVVVALFYGLSGGGVEEEQLLATDVVNDGSPSENVADQELVETLLTLRAITLSGKIFEDPAFRALQDFGTTIVPEPVGRANPFAPLPKILPQSIQSGVRR
jgi:hypothetical protein